MWVSIMPGSTVALLRSTIAAPLGTATLAPTATMRSPSIRITWFVASRVDRPSNSRPARTAVQRDAPAVGAGCALAGPVPRPMATVVASAIAIVDRRDMISAGAGYPGLASPRRDFAGPEQVRSCVLRKDER